MNIFRKIEENINKAVASKPYADQSRWMWMWMYMYTIVATVLLTHIVVGIVFLSVILFGSVRPLLITILVVAVIVPVYLTLRAMFFGK